jgi:hypothetical protein
MAKITVDEDSALQWFVVPEDATYGLTLDLPDATVEWIKNVAAQWGAVQQYLWSAADRHYEEQRARTV